MRGGCASARARQLGAYSGGGGCDSWQVLEQQQLPAQKRSNDGWHSLLDSKSSQPQQQERALPPAPPSARGGAAARRGAAMPSCRRWGAMAALLKHVALLQGRRGCRRDTTAVG